MFRWFLAHLLLLFPCFVFAQEAKLKNSDQVPYELSKHFPATLLVSRNGCFSRREISITILKNGSKFFYSAWASLWNSDAKKRYKFYRKRNANKEQLRSFLQIEEEYLSLKRKQDSLGSILFCDDQLYYDVVLGSGQKAKRIVDSECDTNRFDRLQQTFAIKEE